MLPARTTDSRRFAPQEIRTFFLTLVTANRRRLFHVHENANLMLALFDEHRAKGRYELHAFVIMPDHLHLLLTPSAAIPLEQAIQFIKGGFSFRLKSKLEVWQKGYNEHRIVDPRDYEQHRTYISENPNRAGFPLDYPFTSVTLPQHTDPTPPNFLDH